MANPLDHAAHNENACQYLDAEKKYQDWVITTAFYSALHYTEHKIFPFELKVLDVTYEFENFDEYKGAEIKLGGKHEVRKRLVDDEIPEICAQYKWLLDTCMYARYYEYQHDQVIADQAINYLIDIKDECID